MFELHETPALLASFNSRAERHGQDKTPAADLKFTANVASEHLADFHPTLRHFLFHKDGAVVQDLANETHDAPNLRFPKLAPLKWEAEYIGFSLCIHLGINETSHLVMDGCAVNNFVLAPQEGGTVILTFRVQCHPDEHQAGKLHTLVQNKVDISVLAPDGAQEIIPGADPDAGGGDGGDE